MKPNGGDWEFAWHRMPPAYTRLVVRALIAPLKRINALQTYQKSASVRRHAPRLSSMHPLRGGSLDYPDGAAHRKHGP
jgi:hypothetical protein